MTAGIVLLDKEMGITSAKALARLKHKLGVSKIGHAGTLDPMASGLLVCLTNSATRLASFAQDGAKTYSGTIQFGLTTSSDDITGEVLTRSEVRPRFSEVQAAVQSFIGNLEQIPPRVSAIKTAGVHSYDRARNGEDFVLAARPVRVDSFDVAEDSNDCIRFIIRCSKGTYIRSLARDLGEKLGCGGCLGSLRREATAPFDICDARTIENISASDIMIWDVLFPEVFKTYVADDEASRLLRGEKRALTAVSERLGEEAGSKELAIFYRKECNLPLGILRRNMTTWDYALNIGE